MSVTPPGEEALAMYRRSGRRHAERARSQDHGDHAHQAAFDLLRRAFRAEWDAVAAEHAVECVGHPEPLRSGRGGGAGRG